METQMATQKKPKTDIERIARLELCIKLIFERLNDRLDPVYEEVWSMIKDAEAKETTDEADR